MIAFACRDAKPRPDRRCREWSALVVDYPEWLYPALGSSLFGWVLVGVTLNRLPTGVYRVRFCWRKSPPYVVACNLITGKFKRVRCCPRMRLMDALRIACLWLTTRERREVER